MLLSQYRVTIIFTVKFKIDNIAYTIKGRFEGQSNWNMDQITPLGYAINICTLYRVWFGRKCYLVKDFVAYNQAKCHHPTTFGWRDIAFRIWCLPCNSCWSKWPKTFWAGVRVTRHPWVKIRTWKCSENPNSKNKWWSERIPLLKLSQHSVKTHFTNIV